LVVFFIQLLSQFQLGIGFAFVTETLFGTGTGQFVALLFATVVGPTDTGTGITVEIDSHR
jgi:hypothetical protein